jgi:flavodoxin
MSKKMLVVYYSWSNGNTERIAERLAEACGADLERIETAEPYPEDYDETVAQGQNEVNAGFKPEIEPLEHDVADYDVVAVGTPTWWYTMAPAVKTFFSSANLAGKTVVPFMTNGGWPGSVIDDMQAAATGAVAGPAMEIQFDSTGGARQETPQANVDAWVAEVRALLG